MTTQEQTAANFADYGVQCSVCERPAAAACDWPATEIISVEARFIVKGDVVYSTVKPTIIRLGTVVFTYNHPDMDLRTIAIDTGRGVYQYLWKPGQLLKVERPGQCRAAVCECHLREVAEDRRYCCSHWHLQEELWLHQ